MEVPEFTETLPDTEVLSVDESESRTTTLTLMEKLLFINITESEPIDGVVTTSDSTVDPEYVDKSLLDKRSTTTPKPVDKAPPRVTTPWGTGIPTRVSSTIPASSTTFYDPVDESTSPVTEAETVYTESEKQPVTVPSLASTQAPMADLTTSSWSDPIYTTAPSKDEEEVGAWDEIGELVDLF